MVEIQILIFSCIILLAVMTIIVIGYWTAFLIDKLRYKVCEGDITENFIKSCEKKSQQEFFEYLSALPDNTIKFHLRNLIRFSYQYKRDYKYHFIGELRHRELREWNLSI